jgi:hypothetical protein
MMFPPEPTRRNNSRRIGYAEMAEKLAIDKSEEAYVTWAFNIGYAGEPPLLSPPGFRVGLVWSRFS